MNEKKISSLSVNPDRFHAHKISEQTPNPVITVKFNENEQNAQEKNETTTTSEVMQYTRATK